MSKQVPWNEQIFEEFKRLAKLNPLEVEIMECRIAEMPRSVICDKLGISLATHDRIIARLKVKYDNVQRSSDVLPPRKFSAKETWMDTH